MADYVLTEERVMRLGALLAVLGLMAGVVAACGGGDRPGAVRSTPQSASERPAPAERPAEAARPAAVAEAAERTPDNDAAAALEASRQRQAQGDRAAVMLSPNAVAPQFVSVDGVGGLGGASRLPLRLGPQEYRCEITVTQHRTDAAAGGFSVTFSGDDLLAQTVEVEGPSWTGEAMLPAGGEGMREVELAVRADAADAEWRVACSQGSG